jgi:hypothetical protein
MASGSELRSPAVRVIHKPNAPTDDFEDGEIILDVQRPGRVITGTIHLMHGSRAERAHIDLVDCPDAASDIKVGAGFSDRGDFNIHLHAPKEEVIPQGRYKVGYKVDLAKE